MTAPRGPAIMGGATGNSPAPDPAQAAPAREFDPGPVWMRVLPPAVMLVIALIGITGPSFWRDEAATLAAVRRPFGDMLRMLGNVDAVHGAYYIFAWPLTRVFGYGELALRLPSAIAMCVTAAFVAAIGRRLVSPLSGLLSGLLFAVIPQISFYGQDARSYAFVTTVAAAASYLLVRAVQAGAPAGRRPSGWWIGYALCLGLLGIVNIFALLLIPAHAVMVALRCLRPGPGWTRHGLALRWLAAAVVGGIIASPLLYLGWQQRGQVSWLKVPDGLDGVSQLVGPQIMLDALVGVGAIALIASAVHGWAHLRASWPGGLLQLALPWLIVPPALLLLVSHITPMYTFRYILFCIPAVALLGGTAMAALAAAIRPAALGAVAGAAALVLVGALGLHEQISVRGAAGHKDNIRGVDHLIARLRRPGDVVFYTNDNAESFGAAYRFGLDKLPNVALARKPIPSGTLGGTNAPFALIHQRLSRLHRVWVVNINHNNIPAPVLYGLNYTLVHTYRVSDIWLRLYVRSGAVSG
ncbi:MAG: glycosyltransferase family 39 protein [Streptosporangiaceae bacterium]